GWGGVAGGGVGVGGGFGVVVGFGCGFGFGFGFGSSLHERAQRPTHGPRRTRARCNFVQDARCRHTRRCGA
ncbi:hypothetical protein K6W60_41005, partial [Burkholderia cepacia]|uniref:hypothetical protein n=1 Tax=Burkholderia cepacia TaxID=292 RepID=UPI001C937FA7